MKLIIDIPEEMYQRLKDNIIGADDGGIIINSIQNGTPILDNVTVCGDCKYFDICGDITRTTQCNGKVGAPRDVISC